METSDTRILCHPREDRLEVHELAGGAAVVVGLAAPHRAAPSANEDAAGVLRVGETGAVVAVADGVGGSPHGGLASVAAIEAALTTVRDRLASATTLDELLVPAIDAANDAVLRIGGGAATTLTLATVEADRVRIGNVGDSEALITGQRGRVKFRTTSHSPVGYALEAGILDADEAMRHEERHVVSNTVGSQEMSVDIGAPVPLARRDTLIVASDGLFDNVLADEVVELARKGPLEVAAGRLTDLARRRMAAPGEGEPSKPDDLTLILFRRLR